MSLIPDISELLARARADLRMGLPVVLTDDGGLSVLALASETVLLGASLHLLAFILFYSINGVATVALTAIT